MEYQHIPERLIVEGKSIHQKVLPNTWSESIGGTPGKIDVIEFLFSKVAGLHSLTLLNMAKGGDGVIRWKED